MVSSKPTIGKLTFEKINAASLIVGFTGAIGSGCTYYAQGLAKFHGYHYLRLSDVIREEAESRVIGGSIGDLQDLGNELRRDNNKDYLILKSLMGLEKELKDNNSGDRCKIVVDGIRNSVEVEFLRQFPHFYLISVQAEREIRARRLTTDGKCRDRTDFDAADRRDEEEKVPYGQQVKKCNYLADIIIINEKVVSKSDITSYRRHISG